MAAAKQADGYPRRGTVHHLRFRPLPRLLLGGKFALGLLRSVPRAFPSATLRLRRLAPIAKTAGPQSGGLVRKKPTCQTPGQMTAAAGCRCRSASCAAAKNRIPDSPSQTNGLSWHGSVPPWLYLLPASRSKPSWQTFSARSYGKPFQFSYCFWLSPLAVGPSFDGLLWNVQCAIASLCRYPGSRPSWRREVAWLPPPWSFSLLLTPHDETAVKGPPKAWRCRPPA